MAILGNDISSYQGTPIDFAKMRQAGSQFVYIRAGVGWTKDRFFDQNKIGARTAGIPWGSYWIPWPTQTTGALLDNYEWMLGEDWGDLPPAIDVETTGLGLDIFIYWLNFTEPKWIAKLPSNASAIRRKLLFYTRASHFDQYANVLKYKELLGSRTNLWVAHYTYDYLKKPTLPRYSWTNYLLHQYSADENSLGFAYGVKSIAIDMDYFNESETVFKEWTGLEGGTTPPPPVPVDRYVKIVAKQANGAPGFLFFRDDPSFYVGEQLAIGYGEVLKLLDLNIIGGHWHVVTARGREGYVSAGTKFTQLVL